MSHILLTKLHRPPIAPTYIPRPHLQQRLDAGLAEQRRLTLVSAPAGFGKTSCVSAWVGGLDCPVSWLALDAADDEPGRFFTYVITALQTIDANLGREIEGLLRAGQLPPGEIIITTFSNDLLKLSDRCVLVLDDFQVIEDRFILNVLQQLLANLPESLHLALLTREDRMASFQAYSFLVNE